MSRPPAAGPVEASDRRSPLVARAVTPGPSPRILGYDVQGDLARHHGLADLLFLALAGELPAPGAARAFEVALLFLAPTTVAEPPAHAAVLTRMCGGSAAAVLATGALALAEQGAATLAAHADLLAWLERSAGLTPPSPPRSGGAGRGEGAGAPPAAALARDEEDRAATTRLRAALEGTGVVPPALAEDLRPEAAALAVLHAVGLRDPSRLEAALLVARLPAVAAEAFAATPADLKDYPLDLPAFRYVEDEP